MSYSVKEIFYTLQGEGANAGRPAVFCRFAGCNLWSGREEDRSTAVCTFCDTDFVGTDGEGGGKFRSALDLAAAIEAQWPTENMERRFVVLTGGEPLLQVDAVLIAALHARGFFIAMETNGTLVPPDGIDWLCVSPKANSKLAVLTGQELKLVYPQPGVDPASFTHLAFDNFYLQPMDNSDQLQNTSAAIDYCLQHPRWNLSVQTHKVIGIR
ncbi:7-carboxy-7-deazaguanine synthase (Cx14CxxC type) [Comamonas odontotermitis]|uniref:7-carboxy-7-deazaguanine synthase n=1 Tax=Comamonas odontotermitis TaxID=379895 RepID=A0ABR6RL93_9BURK|nr:7-carboxy-7-deazaguanine synthase [Comamonas odontotermitis]MBB6579922.1 7-carboxy-7-deazaguanine synthase (Cx14CxxC type) [Comamonas odontotermitis]